MSFTHAGDGGTGVDRIRGSVRALTSNLARAFWDADCNENGVADTCDVSCAGFGDDCAAVAGCGESADVGGDGVPDECNRPPDCSTARAEPDRLWPPDHRLREVSLVGVADPDGDAVTTTFTSIRQDEPVLGPGSGRHDRDAAGPGSPTASVRSERSSRGDGRVYRLGFRAEDGFGGSCAGEVRVCVPHDGRRQRSCGDQGPLFDSVQIAPRE